MRAVILRARAGACALTSFVAALSCDCGAPLQATTGRITQETFDSAAADESFTLLVRLPPGYDVDTARSYPVVYQLDATFEEEFARSAGTVSQLAAAGTIPEHLVVGIGHTSTRADRGRFVDFVPQDPGDPSSVGRAAQFYRFMHDELAPYVESHYRVDASAGRALSGHSLGALFTLYAFMQREADGSHFITSAVAADPSYGTNNAAAFGYESSLAHSTPSRPGRLHLSASRFTGATQLLMHNEMSARLARDFPDLSLRASYEDTTHGGLIQRAMDLGFPFALAAGVR